MTKEVIYFDNNATTKLDSRALELMNSIYQNPLNSSSQHQFGQIANKHINQAKEKIADLLNAENFNVIFNSGATESNNLALKGFNNFELVTSNAEHLAVLEVVKKQKGNIIAVDENCLVKIDELETKIKELNTSNFLVSIMLVNNETGVIQNIKEIAKIVHQNGGLIHSDITQGLGKIDIDLEGLNIDLASISAHKIGGPQGVGALLVRKQLQINPLMQGGSQEDGKRPGTTNIAGIAGFGEACKIAREELHKYSKVSELRDYLETKLEEISENNVQIFGKQVNRVSNTSFFSTSNLDNQTLMITLDLNNIAVSIGSACNSGVTKSSHVLKSMGVDDKTSKSAIRISLNKDNNLSQIDKFIDIWQELYFKNNKN